jgi:nucleoside-diphosphate-sugar epimerase
MKVLYIGGTGEISYSCALESVRRGHEVTVLNRGKSDESLPSSVRCLIGSIEDPDVYRVLGRESFDVVCQFLAYERDVVERDVAQFAGRCGQYVFISTASAYEKPPKSCLVTEQTPLRNPYWPYSQAKADLEAFLMQEHQTGRLNVTIVRPSHTVRRRFPGGIVRGDDWAWRMLNGKPILIHGDGTAVWTLTHSNDFAIPFVGLLGNPAALGEAFHITRPMEAYSWNAIYAEMASALQVQLVSVHVPTEVLIRYQPEWIGPLWGDKAHSVLFDNSKVAQATEAFSCRFDLRQIMQQAAVHYHRRAAAYRPDPELHALLDQIAADVNSLGAAH